MNEAHSASSTTVPPGCAASQGRSTASNFFDRAACVPSGLPKVRS